MREIVHSNLDVRDFDIMCRTLDQLGLKYLRLAGAISVSGGGGHVAIDHEWITYGRDHKGVADRIGQEYMVNYYSNMAVKEGLELQEDRMADGSVRLTIRHPSPCLRRRNRRAQIQSQDSD